MRREGPDRSFDFAPPVSHRRGFFLASSDVPQEGLQPNHHRHAYQRSHPHHAARAAHPNLPHRAGTSRDRTGRDSKARAARFPRAQSVPVLHRTGNVRSASDRHPLIVRRALVSSSPPSQPPSPAPSPSALEPAAITNVTPSETWFDHWADRAGPETPFLFPSHRWAPSCKRSVLDRNGGCQRQPKPDQRPVVRPLFVAASSLRRVPLPSIPIVTKTTRNNRSRSFLLKIM